MIFSDRYRQDDNLWMPNEESNFQYSDGDEAENYILNAIQQSGDLSIGSEELFSYIKDWPSLYHLSSKRADLLRPLTEQLKGRKILEIGSGCGTITRFFGEMNCEVLALEGSPRRARITRERCRDLDNVLVVCDNFDTFITEEKFDCITLIGVLEYSNLFIKGDNPPLTMLWRVAQLLKPDGHIIIGIENKLGLKYMAGAPEDHTGVPFTGIENKYTEHTAITWGKEELKLLLEQAGLSSTQFLYPFPDYKLPVAVITDNGLQNSGFDIAGLLLGKHEYIQGHEYNSFFNVSLAQRSIYNNGIASDLANSFLILAAKENCEIIDSSLLAVNYSTSRKKAYCKSVEFRAASDQSVLIVKKNIYNNTGLDESINLVLNPEPYRHGVLLQEVLLRTISVKNWTAESLISWATQYYKVLKEQAQEINGRLYIDGKYIDLAPFNIIIEDNSNPFIFDQEWDCKELLPIEYVFFRGIYYSLGGIIFFSIPEKQIPRCLLKLSIFVLKNFGESDEAIINGFREKERKYFSPVWLQEYETFKPETMRIRNYDLQQDQIQKHVLDMAALEKWREEIQNLAQGVQLLSEQLKRQLNAQKELSDRSDQLNENYKTLAADNEKLRKEHKTFESTNEKNRVYIAELSTGLENAKDSSDLLRNELAQVRQDNEIHKKHLDWFKRTFEDRSLLGVLKEKLKSKFKKTYIGLIDSQLKKESIKKKYAASFTLNYVKENGLKYSVAKVAGKIRKDGFKSISRSALRQKAMEKLSVTEKLAISQPYVQLIDIEAIKESITGLIYKPKISIILPTYNTKPSLLELAILSVKNQLYVNWELCIADDCSTNRETINVLKKYQNENNIKILFLDKNSGISESSNAAINLSTGDYIALMDHDDEITPDALYWVVEKLNKFPQADIVYSDECKVDEKGNLSDYFLKPQWSPELLFNMMYIGHLTVYRKEFLLNEAGFFRKEYDYSQDYDMVLRATEKTEKIYHLDKVIYHWRITEGSSSQGDKPYARISNLAALRDAAIRRNIRSEVIELPTANRLKIKTNVERKVSIIIPTDSYDNLKETIESINKYTSYIDYEILPVTNSKLIAEIKKSILFERVRFVAYDKPYSFSDKCNEGAMEAKRDILLFFNDDVRPLQEDWLENTIEFLQIPGVGGVSPKLIYENSSIQYAGMATGVRNLTGTTFHGYDRYSTQYFNFSQLVRNVSILSGACMAIRKDLFLKVKGFDADNTPISHSDVDLSFKIKDAGFRCVYTPYATLMHIGHQSLKEYKKKETFLKKDKADIFLLKKWAKYIHEDPYFTEPMRKMLYHDSPQYYKIFEPKKKIKAGDKGDIILISHDLALSGAPIMLFNTCKTLQQQGYFVVVFCSTDGSLREMYQDIGVFVIIDELILEQHDSFSRFAKNFDFIICNTIVTWPVVKQMQDIVKTIWWIQEGKVLEAFTSNTEVVRTIQNAQNLIGVSNYSISFIEKFNSNISKIYNACYDIYKESVTINSKLIISLIGSIEARKGHDILMDALEIMDHSLLENVEIRFIGRMHDENFYKQLKKRATNKPYINFVGEKSHKECIDYLQESDIVLNISRDDPFPVVLVEAFCCGKTCIVSSNSGLEELILNGENGFIFKNEDTADLAKKLTEVLQNKNKLQIIGKRARITYKEYLSMEVFTDALKNCMEKIEEAELV